MASTTTQKTSSGAASPLGGVQQLADQARAWWQSAPTPTRVISVGLALLVGLCLFGAVMLATAPQYEDLFTNLDPKDAAAIAAKLDDSHEAYKMGDGETSILVPGASKDRLRMEMIRDGLPAKTGSVVSTDWLDKIGMGTTSDVQDQYIRMANEGELSQTISSMNEVASAAVHLSPGSSSPFADNSTPPSASIVLGLKPGMSLTPDQAEGIANLVAKSVPGLDLKNVAVVDLDGNQVWDGSQQDSTSNFSTNRMNAEADYADNLRKQLQARFDEILGQNKALVSVHAELNFDQVHSVAEQFTKGPVLSTQTADEKYDGSGGGSAAPPAAGIASNTPGGSVPTYPAAPPPGASGGKSGTYDNATETDNYDNSKVDTDTNKAAGTIERLAVAVLVDSSVPPATVSSLQSYCATVAGVTPGDTTRVVTVQSIAFSNTDFKTQQAQMATAQSQARMQEILKVAAVAVIAVVLLMMFLRSAKSSQQAALRGGRRDEIDSQSQYRLSEDELGALGYSRDQGQSLEGGNRPRLANDQSDYDDRSSERERSGGVAVADEPMSIEAILDDMPQNPARQKRRQQQQRDVPEIEQQLDTKLESIREMIKQQPKSVALLMKGWMTDTVEAD